MVAPETSIANTHSFFPPSSMNAYYTDPERPANIAINIQRGRSSSRPSIGCYEHRVGLQLLSAMV